MSNTSQWQAIDAAHHLHPFTDSGALAKKGTRIISRANGIFLYDSDGNEILDGMSGLWCVNLGYGCQELIDAATVQMQELPYYNSFFQCTTPPAIELAQQLAEIAPAHVNHVFFTGSGSEANDTVIRMARHYWACKGKPGKKVFIGRKNGYHGSTIGGASLGGMSAMHKQGDLPIPGVVHIDQPYWFGEGFNEDPQAFGKRIAQQLEDKILELGVDQVAAFIAEPIQGAGGVVIAPDSYWPEIKRICEEYEILLVCDEVICGFGRTGEWFGSDYYGVSPDLMPIAKGLSSGYLPIGGVLVADHIAETLKNSGQDFNHGFTYSGHPTAAAVANATLKIMRRDNLVQRVRETLAPYFTKVLAPLAEHPLVGEVRTTGLLGAIELVQNKDTHQFFADKDAAGTCCRDISVGNGLVMRAVGSTMILCPPMIITEEQLDMLQKRALKTLDDCAKVLL